MIEPGSDSRRNFLKAVVTAPLLTAGNANGSVVKPTSPQDLIRHHIEGLKKAVQDADPRVNCWRISDFEKSLSQGCAIAIAAWRE